MSRNVDHREQAGIRQKRHHATEANPAPSASASRSALRISSVAMASSRSVGNVFHPCKVLDPQAVLVREMAPEIFRVNLDRTQPTENPKTQKAAKVRPAASLLPELCIPAMSISILR